MTHETSKKRPAPGIYQKLAKGKNVAKKSKTPDTSPTRSPVDSDKMNDNSVDEGNDMLDLEGNLSAAVSGLGVEPEIGASTGAVPGDPAQKVVYVRVSEFKHAEWASVAEGKGETLSEFVRQCVDPVVDSVLRCQHPAEFRQAYAWQESCLKCGKRLRG